MGATSAPASAPEGSSPTSAPASATASAPASAPATASAPVMLKSEKGEREKSAAPASATASAPDDRYDAAAWTKFQRPLEPTSQRATRAQKCPEDLALEIRAECAGCKNPKEIMNKWFKMYRKASNDWAEVSVVFHQTKRLKTEKGGEVHWWNDTQMLEHYKTRHLVDTIKQHLIDQGQAFWKPDPTCPTLEALVQYRCVVFETEKFKEEMEHEQKLSLKARLSPEAAGMLGGGTIPGFEHVAGPGVPAQFGDSPALPHVAAASSPSAIDETQKEKTLQAKVAQLEQRQADLASSQAQKADKIRQRKEERDRVANLASSKANGWKIGFEKKIREAKELLKDLRSKNSVPESTIEFHAQKIKTEMNKISKKIKDIDAAQAKPEDETEDACAAEVQTCKQILDAYKVGEKRWKKTLKNYES